MALQTYTWNNGTSENPVELNPTQLSLLLKLALDTSVQSDVRGHITTSSGRISKYTKWQLNQKYGENLVIHAEEDDDVFSIIPVRNAINEGESTVITVTGMSASSVKFRLLHSFRNVYGISQDKAQARIHMEGNTLVVNQPEENASWTDEVTIQAIPLYEDWNTIDSSSIVSCTVTVSAKELTGIVLTSPSMVVYGEMFQSEVTLIPSSNTKKNFVTFDAICITDGSIPVRKPTTQGVYIYTQAPSEQCNLTLTVNAYLFNDLDTIVFSAQGEIESAIPYIRFIVTTDGTFSDISTANPKITLQKVDSEDTPIGEPIILTGTVSGSSLVYTYGGGAGGNVTGDGSETYKVTFGDAPEGYRNIQQMTITPNQVITEISVQYVVKRPDIYQVYADGTYEPISIVDNLGTFYPNKLPLAIAIVTENTSFMFAVRDNEKVKGKLIAGSVASADIQTIDCTVTSFKLYAVIDYDFKRNTIGLHNYFADGTHTDGDCHVLNFPKVDNLVIGQQSLTGYIGAGGQIEILFANFGLLNDYIRNHFNIYQYIGYNSYYCSSTLEFNNNCWTGRYYDGSFFGTRNVASVLEVLPIYEFNEDLYTKLPQRG